MLNSAPNKRGKYNQGLYLPKYPEKVIKLNQHNGLYYRSGMELKMMRWLDFNDFIIKWSSEILEIPYKKQTFDNKTQSYKLSEHTYYPDFYYEIMKDNKIIKMVAEIKPSAETKPPTKINENASKAQLRNYNYAIKEYNKNMNKWNYCIEWCKKNDCVFIIVTEKILN